jgi:N-acetyl-gamma-glutamyl-phosphate reductase
VLFLCVGHGEAKKFLEENDVHEAVKIIDLSQDFRLHPTLPQAQGKPFSKTHAPFVYGLPELTGKKYKVHRILPIRVALPQPSSLACCPWPKPGCSKKVYTTGITGSTGAGQSLTDTSHFSWRANNIQAYKTLNHQHLKEIDQSLQQLNASQP